jgi:hypothetical protein
MRSLRTWWLTVLFLAACGGGSGSKAVPLDDLDEAVAKAFCDLEIDCGRVTDRAACGNDLYTDDTPQLVASVRAGKIRYDGAAAADCLADISTLCTKPISDDANCDAAFTGLVTVGGACLSDTECASDRCDKASCDATVACCRGVCLEALPTIAVGGTCSGTDADCVKGAYCDYVGAPGVSTCKLIGMKAEGQPCDGARACAGGLYCSDTKVCTRPPKRGEACDPTEFLCNIYQDYCDPETLVCTARRAAGEACNTFSACDADSHCDLDGTKRCVADGAEGEACLGASCRGSLECQNGLCVRPAAPPACP